jgi:hypothetical protein
MKTRYFLIALITLSSCSGGYIPTPPDWDKSVSLKWSASGLYLFVLTAEGQELFAYYNDQPWNPTRITKRPDGTIEVIFSKRKEWYEP